MSTPAEEAAALVPTTQRKAVVYLGKDSDLDGYAQLGAPFTVHTFMQTRDAEQNHSEVEPAESLAQARQKARERDEAKDADALMIGGGGIVSSHLKGGGYSRTDRVYAVVAYKIRGEEKDDKIVSESDGSESDCSGL